MRRIGKSFFLWMKSFVIIMIGIVVALTVLTNWMLRIFSEEIKVLNHNLTSIVQRSVDIRLRDISDFTTQLELNNINIKVSNFENTDFLIETDIYSLKRQLTDYKLSNAFVEDIFIYYPKLDYVIGDLGHFKSKQYYILSNHLKSEGYNLWLSMVQLSKNAEYFFYEKQNGEFNLYFSRQLAGEDTDGKNSILIIKIKKEEVLKLLNDEEVAASNSLVAILSEDNKIYTYYGSEAEAALLTTLSEKDYSMPMITLNDYLGSIRKSDFYGIKYVTLINRKYILNSMHYVRNIAYISLFFCAVFGIGLFALMSRRNYRSVANLLNRLQEKSQPLDGTAIVDEYGFINNKIDRMLADNRKSLEKLEEQREIIEGLFLSNLLSSEERNNSVIFASIQRYNLQFEYSLFQIVLIRSEIGFERQESKQLIADIVDRIKEMKLELYVVATEYSGDIVLLFNMEQDFTMEKMVEGLRVLQEDMKKGSLVVFGGIYDSMSHIFASYYEALMTADNSEKDGQTVLVFDANAESDSSGGREASGFMTEYELDMIDGNYEDAKKRIDILFNQYIASDKHSFTSRCKKYAVLNPLVEAMRKIEEEHRSFDREYYYNQLSSTKDSKSFLKIMHKIFDEIIEVSRKAQSDTKMGIAEKAKEYIHHNYENSMLGLYSISEYLGVSNTYLSTIFKKSYNMGIPQYINKLRIEKAKKLILNTEYNIKEIALSVGFSSDVTFIRVFKQFENTTPKKYREN